MTCRIDQGKSISLACLKDAFRLELLRPTLSFAARHSRFYMELWEDRWKAVNNLDELAVLPVTSKSLLREVDRTRLLTSSEQPFIIQHTSGTTDRVFQVYRNRNEVAFIQSFFSKELVEVSKHEIQILSFQPAYHGEGIPISAGKNYLNFDITSKDEHAKILNFLIKGPLHPRNSYTVIITGIFHHIRFLTLCLQQLEYDFKRSPVTGIYVTGQHVSPRWDGLLKQIWKRPIINRFSLTEGFGGAVKENSESYFVFEHVCIPEVLDISTGVPINEGIGLLHLTSLYPFVQLMPFVRYRTNDIVSVIPGRMDGDLDPRFTFLGRYDHATIVEHNSQQHIIILPTPLFDFIDSLTDVNHDNVMDITSGRHTPTGAGNPKYRISAWGEHQTTVFVEIELRYNPAIYPQKVQMLEGQIYNRILETNAAARDLTQLGAVVWKIAFLAPGSLESFDPSATPECLSGERYGPGSRCRA